MSDDTFENLAKAALRKTRVIDPLEDPSVAEFGLCFEEFKRMLHEWAAAGTYVYASVEDTHTLSSGTASYTIGSGATINTARPVKLLNGCYVNANGLDYPLQIIGETKYQGLQSKDSGFDYPIYIFYKPGYANGTIYLWPPGAGTLHLISLKRLAEPATYDADMVLPEEYQSAVVYNLAIRMAPEFGAVPDQFVYVQAERTLQTIRELNISNDFDVLGAEVAGMDAAKAHYNIDGDWS